MLHIPTKGRLKRKGLFLIIKYVVPAVALAAAVVFLVQVIISFFMLVVGAKTRAESNQQFSMSKEVELYRDEVSAAAGDLDILDYVNNLMAIMQTVSGGLGTDIMASSPFDCNTKYPKTEGGITEPAYSILCGAKQFKFLIDLVGITTPEDSEKLLTVYQAYVYGVGFISHLNGAQYTLQAAEMYRNSNSNLKWPPDFANNVARYVSIQLHSIGEWVFPLTTINVTCKFGLRIHPITGKQSNHTGVDLSSPHGTPIYAANDGVVTKVRTMDSIWGNQLYIEHTAVFTTMYAHCSSLAVKQGDYVTRGQIIAYVGTTGLSTGNHLHFEVQKSKMSVDPIEFYKNLEENNK